MEYERFVDKEELEFDCSGNMSYSQSGGQFVFTTDIREIQASKSGQGYARNQLELRINASTPLVDALFAPCVQSHTGRILVATPVPKADRVETTSTSGNTTTDISNSYR